MSRLPGPGPNRSVRRRIAVGVAGLLLTGCASAPPAAPPSDEPGDEATAGSEAGRAATARAFFAAYGGGDAGPLVEHSSPGSPARDYADYWGDVVRAGRTSAAPERVDATAAQATLAYADGSEYRFDDLQFDRDDRLVSWRNVPGGTLRARILARQRTVRLGPLRLDVRHQYRSPDGDLRVTMLVRNRVRQTWNLARGVPRGYLSPDGSRSVVTLGSGRHTGVVPVPAGSHLTVLVSAEDARPGGRLELLAYDSRNTPTGRVVVALPRPNG